jgi:uroporphyrinogen decarboxylase
MNAKFKNALAREPQNVPPIWFMRQAGRYHKHYQALRAKHTFMEMCKDPKLAAEVALGPVLDFDFDVSILFSDLLFPLEAMGMGLKYEPGPVLGWHLTPDRLKELKRAPEAMPHLQFQKQAAIETRKVLPKDKSLIGFVGGPWTLFTYAVEGAHKGGLEASKRSLALFKPFCEILVPILIENIKLQLEGGAELVMLFDTSAGEVAPVLYRDVIVPSLEQLARAYPRRLGYYAKGIQPAHHEHPAFNDPGLFAGLGYDHRWELSKVLPTRKTGFVQGNFDQSLLFCAPDEFRAHAMKYLESMKKLTPEQRAGWVSGLGHGVLPGTPEENVRDLVKLVREVLA